MPQAPGSPPTIETARLVLGAHSAGDLDAFAAMWADLAVVRHIGGQPSSRQESWHRLLRHRGTGRCWGSDIGRCASGGRAASWATSASRSSAAPSSPRSKGCPRRAGCWRPGRTGGATRARPWRRRWAGSTAAACTAGPCAWSPGTTTPRCGSPRRPASSRRAPSPPGWRTRGCWPGSAERGRCRSS